MSASSSVRRMRRAAVAGVHAARAVASSPAPVAISRRPGIAPSPLVGALGAIEGVGFILAEAGRSGHGLDALSCDDVCAQLRRVYVVVRALRSGSQSAAGRRYRFSVGGTSGR